MFFRGKGLFAVLAKVRLGARVRIDVSLQGVIGLKARFAEMTRKRLLSGVGKQVAVELTPVPELPAAVGTLGTHHAGDYY